MPNLPPIRTNFYIDGFNVYHRIVEYHQKTGVNFRWLSYRNLLMSKLKPPEEIGKIYFFTAVRGDPDKIARHNSLIQALTSEDVEVVHGNFVGKKEKKTDVNIAMQMLMDAFNNTFDHCFLLSADSDLVPAVRAVGAVCPVQLPLKPKKVGIITPPYEHGVVTRRNIRELSTTAALKTIELEFKDLVGCSFPPIINTPHGGVIKMPKAYSTF